jgi:hypothetical protein
MRTHVNDLDDHLFKVSVRDVVEAKCPQLKPLEEG